jgi:chromatin remodeling complex protein RSC6
MPSNKMKSSKTSKSSVSKVSKKPETTSTSTPASSSTTAAASTPASTPASTTASAPDQDMDAVNTVSSNSDTFSQLLDDFNSISQNVTNSVKELNTIIKRIQKEHSKVQKTLEKKQKKKNNNVTSCFSKPTMVSNKLSSFMGLGDSQLVSRTDVTKYITTYIKDHNLQKPEDKRQIIMDKSLEGLLAVPSTATLTYFNLQTYLKPHYITSGNNTVTQST